MAYCDSLTLLCVQKFS